MFPKVYSNARKHFNCSSGNARNKPHSVSFHDLFDKTRHKLCLNVSRRVF